MHMRLRRLLTVLVLAGLAPMELAAQPGVLRGTVTDTTGRPLPNVEVLSVNAKRSARTDAAGRFTLAKL
ncbi:MAG: carboxypeptidase-like regulatory domain-containing protein, partial [Gemmatimonadota bacterium]